MVRVLAAQLHVHESSGLRWFLERVSDEKTVKNELHKFSRVQEMMVHLLLWEGWNVGKFFFTQKLLVSLRRKRLMCNIRQGCMFALQRLLHVACTLLKGSSSGQ